MRVWHFASVLAGLAAAAGLQYSVAQEFPSKPVRVIVPGPPAGGADVVARAMGPQMSQGLGQQIVIENRAGANGLIATELTAKSVPDGYTIILGTSSAFTLNPNLLSKVPYDPIKSFAPISFVCSAALLLVVHPSVPAKTVRDLVKLAKARPGQIFYASNGTGSLSHLTTELFRGAAGVDIVHVPYKGGTPAVIDTVSGQVSLLITAIPTLIAQVRAGRVRPLAVTGAKRSQALPDVPTVAESGVPGFSAFQWYAMFAPAETSPQVVRRLNSAVSRAVSSPDVEKVFAREGLEGKAGSPQELAAFVSADLAKWANVIQTAKIRAD